MPSKFPVCKSSDVCKAFEKMGFFFVSQNGSHMKYTNGVNVVIIPNHREIAKGTLKSILEMANISLDTFMKHL